MMNQPKKTLVIGASTNPERYSYKAIKSLRNHQHEVVAIGNQAGTVADVNIKTEKEIFANIDTVTMYLNPTIQELYVDYILSIKPKRIIFNPGAENPLFSNIARDAGINVENACTLVLLATGQY